MKRRYIQIIKSFSNNKQTTNVINEMASSAGGSRRAFNAVSAEMTGGPALWNITHTR